MTLKIAVFAPMPMASVTTATLVKSGILARLRSAWFRRMANHTLVRVPGFKRPFEESAEFPVYSNGFRTSAVLTLRPIMQPDEAFS
jgi:hypothetical protein